MILTREEITDKKNKSKLIDLKEDHFQNHHKKYSLKEYMVGKFFLYEKLLSRGNDIYHVSYPKLGLFIDTYMVDMAVEAEWIDVRRTWEYKVEYEYEHNNNIFTNLVCEDRNELQSLIVWHHQLYVYGSWDVKPNIKELRQAYEKTLWYGKTIEEQRDININRILKI